MVRSIAEIKLSITSKFLENETLESMYGFDPEASFESQFSKVSFESIMFDILSVVIWTIESVLDISMSDQNNAIKAQKVHSYKWYADIAKKFQYGYDLPTGEVEYDNTLVSDGDVSASQKVKFASVSRVPGGLKVKIAGIVAGELSPLSAMHYDAFVEYMSRVKAAGDNITYVNAEADKLKLELKIFRNPLILDALGKRTDGTDDTPIQKAIDSYIKGMDFDKRFVPTFLLDKIQAVEGVDVPELVLAQWKFALFPWSDIPAEGIVPDSGYVRLYNDFDLVITYEIWEG